MSNLFFNLLAFESTLLITWTKVHLKWELNVFSNLKNTVTKNCLLHNIWTNIMDHKNHLAIECTL